MHEMGNTSDSFKWGPGHEHVTATAGTPGASLDLRIATSLTAAKTGRRGHAGTQRERAVRKRLEEDGWFVMRAAGSKGCGDLIAGKRGFPTRLIQVKGNAVNAYKTFVPAERKRISEAARQAGWEAWLVWWPPRGACTWIPEGEWPSGNTAD